MSKVGTMHVLDSQASPSSSSLAIQNTWSVLAGSANNGTVGKGLEYTDRLQWPGSIIPPTIRARTILCASANDPWQIS